jgi:hypothetical protein
MRLVWYVMVDWRDWSIGLTNRKKGVAEAPQSNLVFTSSSDVTHSERIAGAPQTASRELVATMIGPRYRQTYKPTPHMA